MKKFGFITILAVLMLSACNLDTPESYFTPSDIELIFSVENSSGANLLDSTTVNYFPDSTITCTFKGNSYTCNEKASDVPILRTYSYYNSQEFKQMLVLYFGYLAGDVNYDDDLVINWPDGTKDTIHILNECTYATGVETTTTRTPVTELNRLITHNGETVFTLPIYIEK